MAQAQPGVHGVLLVHRQAQVAEGLVRVVAHAGQQHHLPINLKGHHVVVELACLPTVVAQAVGHRGAHVAHQLFARRLGTGAQVVGDRGLEVHLAHIGTRAAGVVEVLNVDDLQPSELQLELFFLAAQDRVFAHAAFHLKRLAPTQGQHPQLEPAAAVVKAALVDGNAPVKGRFVDLDRGRYGLPGRAVVDHDLAGEQLGHAGFVVVDDELLELDVKRQVLQHHPTGHVQQRHALAATLGHQHVAAIGQAALRQAVPLRHFRDQAAPREHALALKGHLQPHHQVAIAQTADANQHDGGMGRQVAQFVGHALARGDHRAGCALAGAIRRADLGLGAPAACHQQCGHAVIGRLRRFGHGTLGLVVKRLQRLLPDVFLVGAQLGRDLGRVAQDAQRGGGHQEGQDQQEPPGAVDGVQVDPPKQVGPKRAELVHVVVQGLALLDHRADHRGDADHRQQRDRKAHRRQQFHRLLHEGRTAANFQSAGVGGAAHRLTHYPGGLGAKKKKAGRRPASGSGLVAPVQRRPLM